MSSLNCDTFVPNHISSAVNDGDTLTGADVTLNGAMAISIQCTCTDGASGTLYVDGTNQKQAVAYYITVSNLPVGADQTILATSSLGDDLTSMHVMRCRFVASSAGHVQVSINVRLTTN